MEETPEDKRVKVVENASQLHTKITTTEQECKSKKLELEMAKERENELEHTVRSLQAQIMAAKKRIEFARKKIDESEKKEEREKARYLNNMAQIQVLRKQESKKIIEYNQLETEIQLLDLDMDKQKQNQIRASAKKRYLDDEIKNRVFHLRLLEEKELIKTEKLTGIKEKYEMKSTVMMMRNSNVEQRLEAAEDKVKELTEKVNKKKSEVDELEKKRLECEKEFELNLSDSDTESENEEVADDKKKNEHER